MKKSSLLLFAFQLALVLKPSLPVHAAPLPIEFEDAKAAADSGDSHAQAVVAMHYSLGWKVQKNPELALDYAQRSATAGEALGFYRLGALLRAGDGIPKDEEEGLRLQSRAIQEWNGPQQKRLADGDPSSLLAVGILYFQGKLIDGDKNERQRIAANLYRQAADSGFAPAKFNYAMCLWEGHGVPKDRTAAEKLVNESAANSYPPAIKWLEDQGKPVASNSMADIPEPAPQNDSKDTASLAPSFSTPLATSAPVGSFEEYKKLADEGDASAQAVVAWHYEMGWPVEKNIAQAEAYAKKSADQGNPLGLAKLGHLESYKSNNPQAGAEFKRRALNGLVELAEKSNDPHALAILGMMFFYGDEVPENKAQGIACLRASADSGFPPAQHQIAIWAREGIGIPASDSVFRDYAKKAAAQGYQPSVDLLEFSARVEADGLSKIDTKDSKNITNVSSILSLLPNIVGDPILLDRLTLSPIDTTIYRFEDSKFERIQLPKADYIKSVSALFGDKALPTIRTLKQDNELFTKVSRIPELNYISPEASRRIAAEIADEDSQFLSDSPAYLASGSGQRGAWICSANGIILVDNWDEPAAFIPAEVIAKAKSFSLVGSNIENRYGGYEGVEAFRIHCDDGEEFTFPPHNSFSALLRGMMPSDSSPLARLAAAFNYHKALHNFSILQNFMDATASKPSPDAPRLLGYTGIQIGMPQRECLDVLRDTVNYHTFHPVETLNCIDPADMKSRDGDDALNYMRDLQIASNGLTLVPPWTMATIRPKAPTTDPDHTRPTDVFVFKENRLVAIGRYPNTEGSKSSRMGYPEHSDDQRAPKDHSQLKVMVEKYGEPFALSAVFSGQNNSNPHTFQFLWAGKDPVRVGAVFKLNRGKFLPLPNNLKATDRIRNFGNTTYVDSRGHLIPIDGRELDFSGARDELSSLRCAYYWDADSAELLEKTASAHMASLVEKQQEIEKSKIQKITDEL